MFVLLLYVLCKLILIVGAMFAGLGMSAGVGGADGAGVGAAYTGVAFDGGRE